MAKTYRLLTWHKARRVWRKKYKGKLYYLSHANECNGPDDLAGYQQAVARWAELKSKIDGTNNNNTQPATRQPHAREASPVVFLADYKALKSRRKPRASSDATPPNTIAGLIDAYVDGRRIETTAGQLSLDSYREAKFKLAEFAEYCQSQGLTDINEVTAVVLNDYRQCQIELTDETKADPKDLIGRVTCHKRLARLLQFLEHTWEQGLLSELPRNIKRFARISFKGEVSRVKRLGFYTLEECRNFFHAAYYKQVNTGEEFQRTRLYIALALNCGYTQKDIATLEHRHVDWKNGWIDRPRHKTGAEQKHKLFPVTLALLKAEQSDPHRKFLLLGRNGNRLIVEKIRPDGIPSTTDSVKLAFNRVKDKLGMRDDPRGFATFRKTAANMLAKQYEGQTHIIDLFLGHTTQATRKHYVEHHYDAYFAALTWLGEYLALS